MDIYTNNYFSMDMYTSIVLIHYIGFYVCKCIWVYIMQWFV